MSTVAPSLARAPGHHGCSRTHGPRHVRTAAPSLSPPEIQVDSQPRAQRPGATSRRTQPGGCEAGTRPSQVSRSNQAPHQGGPQIPGLRNNPRQTSRDCKLSCKAAFCQPPQQTLLPFAELALHAHCPARTHTVLRAHTHTHTHADAVYSWGPVNSSPPLPCSSTHPASPLHHHSLPLSTHPCPPLSITTVCPSPPTPARPLHAPTLPAPQPTSQDG